MSRRPGKFTQSDVTRTIKGAVGAGVPVCITIDPRDGTIKIEPIVEPPGPLDPKRPIVL